MTEPTPDSFSVAIAGVAGLIERIRAQLQPAFTAPLPHHLQI